MSFQLCCLSLFCGCNPSKPICAEERGIRVLKWKGNKIASWIKWNSQRNVKGKKNLPGKEEEGNKVVERVQKGTGGDC